MRGVASGEPEESTVNKNGDHQTPREFYGVCSDGKSIKRADADIALVLVAG